MKLKARFKNFNNTFPLIFGLLALVWLIELVNNSLQHALCQYGIYPRTEMGLRGIILAPLLHGSLDHLILNSVPFLILGSFVATEGRTKFLKVTVFIILLAGALTWVLAAPGFHVGMSAVIFGYFGYLLATGYYQRNFTSILIAAIVIFFYGGIILGVLPTDEHVSWEGHLFGLLSGIVSARFLK